MIPGIVAGYPVAGGSGGGDPYWANVVSCLNFIGSDGATSTTDDKGIAWSFFGNAQIDTAQSANGTSSLLLDGNGDYLSTPDASSLRSDIDPMTMEIFIKPANTSKLQVPVCKRGTSTVEFGLYVQVGGAISLNVYRSGGAVVSITSAGTVNTTQFHHVAIVRNGAVWYLFLNGVLEGSATQSNTPQVSTTDLTIGREPFNTGRDFNGWIGGWRRTNGVARWTTGFTPPAAPFPTS